MPKLTADQKAEAKDFLNELFIASNATDKKDLTYLTARINFALATTNEVEFAAIICHELIYREFKFPDVDRALVTISNMASHPSAYRLRYKYKKPAISAKYIAAFCSDNGLLWDDINIDNKTKIELQWQKENGILCPACWEFKCFLSQQSQNITEQASGKLDEAKNDADNLSTKDEIKQSHGYYNIGNIDVYEKE